jgi:hypothetical protein
MRLMAQSKRMYLLFSVIGAKVRRKIRTAKQFQLFFELHNGGPVINKNQEKPSVIKKKVVTLQRNIDLPLIFRK